MYMQTLPRVPFIIADFILILVVLHFTEDFLYYTNNYMRWIDRDSIKKKSLFPL